MKHNQSFYLATTVEKEKYISPILHLCEFELEGLPIATSDQDDEDNKETQNQVNTLPKMRTYDDSTW